MKRMNRMTRTSSAQILLGGALLFVIVAALLERVAPGSHVEAASPVPAAKSIHASPTASSTAKQAVNTAATRPALSEKTHAAKAVALTAAKKTERPDSSRPIAGKIVAANLPSDRQIVGQENINIPCTVRCSVSCKTAPAREPERAGPMLPIAASDQVVVDQQRFLNKHRPHERAAIEPPSQLCPNRFSH